MAKTKGPLLSLDAHGSLAKELTYSSRRSGSQVRRYNKPLVTPSGAQRGQRRLTEFLVAQWQNMSDADKTTWEINAKAWGGGLPGYHYFLRETQRDLYKHHGLCGYWHCNAIVSGKVLDISGNANHGTLKPTHPSNAPVLVSSKDTRFSNALKYDGIDEYVLLPNTTSLRPTDAITMIVWCKPASLGNYMGVFARYFFWDGLRIRDSHQNSARITTADNGLKGISGASAVAGKWQCTALTYDKDAGSNNFKLYINGVQSGTPKTLTGKLTKGGQAWTIGAGSPGYKVFFGIVDEACMYNRALSAAEILTRYKIATTKI